MRACVQTWAYACKRAEPVGTMALFQEFSSEFVRNCCRSCGKAVAPSSRRALFSAAGRDAKIAERLSTVAQIVIRDGDGLPHFCCKRCVSRLDRLTTITAEAAAIKQELSANLMDTTTRLQTAIRWKSGSSQQQQRTPQSSIPRMRSPTTPASALRQPHKKARFGCTPTTPLRSGSCAVGQDKER